jgi:molybdopterin-guanine dinucleotide biosynthesis protein A
VTNVAGIVLCGGQSSRMGRPKAWLPVAGELMLPRVVRLLSEIVSPIVVVAAPEQELPPLPPDVIVVNDPVPGRGPLQGLATGLAALATNTGASTLHKNVLGAMPTALRGHVFQQPMPTQSRGHGTQEGFRRVFVETPDAVYATSCDVPLLRPAFVRRMIDLLGDHLACVPQLEGQLHPLAAVYRRDVRAVVDQLLAEDRLRLTTLFDLVPTRFVTTADLRDVDPNLRSLRNLNSPDDYAAALHDLRGEPK